MDGTVFQDRICRVERGRAFLITNLWEAVGGENHDGNNGLVHLVFEKDGNSINRMLSFAYIEPNRPLL